MQIRKQKMGYLWYANRILFTLLCVIALYCGPFCQYLQQYRNSATINEHHLQGGAISLKTLYLPCCNSREMPFQIRSLNSMESLQIQSKTPTRLLLVGGFFLYHHGTIVIKAISSGQVEINIDGQNIASKIQRAIVKLPAGRHLLRVTYANKFPQQELTLSVRAKNQRLEWEMGNDVYLQLARSCRRQFSLQPPSKTSLLLQVLITLALLGMLYPRISRLNPSFDTVLLIAALLRSVFVMKYHHLANFIYSDMHGYWTRAWEFYANALSSPYHSFYPPGTHWFFGAWLKCFGKNLYLLEIAMILLSTGIVSLTMRIALDLLGKTQALIAGVLCAFHFPFINFSGLLMSEVPFIFLQTLAIYFLVMTFRKSSRQFLLFSSVVAISAYFRSASLLLLSQGPLLLLSYKKQGLAKSIQLSILGLTIAAIIVLPCTLRNKRLTGEFHLISSNGGINFLQGNLDIRQVNFNTPKGRWSFCSPLHAISRSDSADFNTNLAPWESKKLFEIAWKHIRQKPQRALKRCFDKSLDIFSRYPPWPSSVKFVYLNYVYHTLYLFILIPLALAGVGVIFWQKRWFSLVILLIPIANAMAVAFVFYGTSRFRLPADPFLLILGAVGIDAIAKSDRRLQKKIGILFSS